MVFILFFIIVLLLLLYTQVLPSVQLCVHFFQTVSVVGMSGQLKRCNESWFGSLQSGQFAAGWLAGSILCR